MTPRIVWLAPPNMVDGLKSLMEKYMRQAKLPMHFVHCQRLTGGMWKKRTPKIWHADPERKNEFLQRLIALQPTHIIINDRAALEYLTVRYNSLARTRGSVYEFPCPRHDGSTAIVPCIVIDEVQKVKQINHAGFCLLNDFAKFMRWFHGRRKPEAAFSYTVCSSRDDIDALERAVAESVLASLDVETSGTGPRSHITCDGYCTWSKTGELHSWVVPFTDPTQDGGRYWQNSADEEYVHAALRRINASDTPKVLQNGSYDCHYYVRYRRPLCNYLFDTAVAWHSIWPEIPKRIDFIASIGVDHYRYWKDEHKEDDKTDAKGAIKVPQTKSGLESYWRYNALDTYYTLLCASYIFPLLAKPELAWALENYQVTMRQVLGPAASMSMTGVHVNPDLQREMTSRNRAKADDGLREIRLMSGHADFNPNSNPQVAALLYDTWQAEPLKRGKYKGKSCSEVALKIVQTQSPLIERIIEAIWHAKKPANNLSKYGVEWWEDSKRKGLALWGGRWYYTQSPTGTETGRYSSSHSNWWVGTQVQNPPYEIRNMVDADPGMWMFDADYSQSDNWYTAFTSAEPNMMRAVMSPEDTHCMHASQFFQKPYEELYEGYKRDDPKITDSTTGIRQITKRVVYGSNYLMAAYTLFLTMGKRAVIAAAKTLGHEKADSWTLNQLVNLCQHFIDIYFGQMYPGIKPWLQKDSIRVIQNGSRAVCGFGRTRTFFGNVAEKDSAAQRELAAFYGQGGTAGCVNLALDRLYWQSDFYRAGAYLQFQMHDSIVGQIPAGRLDLLDTVLECMRNPCTINGRTFTVPAEMSVGLGWGKRMTKYIPGKTTVADIEEADAAWRTKWQKAA